jgi:hypothetical protein
MRALQRQSKHCEYLRSFGNGCSIVTNEADITSRIENALNENEKQKERVPWETTVGRAPLDSTWNADCD